MDLSDSLYEEHFFSLERPFTAEILRTRTDSTEVPAHYHRFMEMIYFLSGRGGQVTVDGNRYRYRRGDLIFIRPYALHSYRLGSLNQKFLIARLDYAAFLSLFAGSRLEQRVHRYLNRFHHIRPVQQQVPDNIVGLLREAGSSSGLSCIAGVFRIQPGLKILDNEDGSPGGDFMYSRLLTYLEEHYQDKVTLDTAAGICSMSRYHFSRTFKQFYTAGWAKFLQKFRLEKSTGLLLETGDDIGTIAYATGFTDPSYYIRIFRENYGLTPAEYRLRNTAEPLAQ